MLTCMLLLAFAQDRIDWKKDHDAALKEAAQAGRYVIVHFSGPN